jgi:hypothetical protein
LPAAPTALLFRWSGGILLQLSSKSSSKYLFVLAKNAVGLNSIKRRGLSK